MGPFLECVLAAIGLYLLVYRGFIRTRCRFWVELFAQIACGTTVVILAPLPTALPPAAFAVLLLLLGALVGTCHSMLCVLAVCISLGSFVGALCWQLGLSDALGGVLPHAFSLLMLTTNLVFSVVFCATPIGPVVFERLLVPLVGASLLSSAVAGLAPVLGALPPGELIARTSPTSDASAQVNLLLWAGFAALGVVMQYILLRRRRTPQATDSNALKASLLFDPSSAQDEEGSLIPRPNDEGSRFQVLVKAIFAEPGADQSHLSEHEKKLVEVCQKDEFERDRVLWGGGLI